MIESGNAGAYGMRIAGLPGAQPWMQPLPPAAPWLRLDVQIGRSGDRPSAVDAQSADISLLGGGRLRARRDAGTIEYVLSRPPDEAPAPRTWRRPPRSCGGGPGDGRSVRGGDRRRVTLPLAPHSLPLAGVAVLEWARNLEVEAVPVRRRMHYLAPQRSFTGLDASAVALLHLMAVPTMRFTRPPGPASLKEVGRALLETFG